VTSSALPYLSVARLSGPDAESFLQAQLSADIARLEDGGCTFACYLSPRGQVFGLLLVCRTPDDFFVVGAASLLPGMLQRLRLYVLRARVELALAMGLAVHGVAGAERAAPEVEVFRPPVGDLAYQLRPADEPMTGAADPWRERELALGVAWLGPETTERFIPQMLGFEGLGAVSFSKGCYPGQEIVARAKYLGRVKRGPLRLAVEADPIPAGATVRLTAGGESLDATVVDAVAGAVAGTAGGCLVLMVAPELPGPVDSLDFEGRSYRCATM